MTLFFLMLYMILICDHIALNTLTNIDINSFVFSIVYLSWYV